MNLRAAPSCQEVIQHGTQVPNHSDVRMNQIRLQCLERDILSKVTQPVADRLSLWKRMHPVLNTEGVSG